MSNPAAKKYVYKQIEPEFWELLASVTRMRDELQLLTNATGNVDEHASESHLNSVRDQHRRIGKHLKDIERWLEEIRVYGSRLG